MTTDTQADDMAVEVAKEVVRKTDSSKQSVVELADKFRDAAKFLDESTDEIKTSWVAWLKDSKAFLDEARLWRMAMERESSQGITACKDMVEFLGSEDVRGRLATLRELVEVAERLKALKESGFLDAVVDTMLKVQ